MACTLYVCEFLGSRFSRLRNAMSINNNISQALAGQLYRPVGSTPRWLLPLLVGALSCCTRLRTSSDAPRLDLVGCPRLMQLDRVNCSPNGLRCGYTLLCDDVRACVLSISAPGFFEAPYPTVCESGLWSPIYLTRDDQLRVVESQHHEVDKIKEQLREHVSN